MAPASEKRNPPGRAGSEGAQADGRERRQGTTAHHGLRPVADVLPEVVEELFQRYVAGRQA
jgi:hypothetical protein